MGTFLAEGMRCHCGSQLLGDTDREVYICQPCGEDEDDCECSEMMEAPP